MPRKKRLDNAEVAPRKCREMALAVPSQPAEVGREIIVQTNVFGLKIRKQPICYMYDVTMTAATPTSKDSVIFFTKKSMIDVYSTERKERSAAAFQLFVAKNKDIFAVPEGLAYDRQSLLFSTDRLDKVPQGEPLVLGLDLDETEAIGPLAGFQSVRLEVKSCMDADGDDRISLGDIKGPNAAGNLDIINNAQRVLQYFHVVISKYSQERPEKFLTFEKGKVYLKKPLEEGVDQRELGHLPDGKQLMVGSHSQVFLLEGPSGRNKVCVGLAIDAKKAAFHKEQSAPEKAMEIIPGFQFDRPCSEDYLSRLRTVFKGLVIGINYGRAQKGYKVINVLDSSKRKIMVDGKEMTVEEYYMAKYNHKMMAPFAPLLEVQSKRSTMFPLEVCRILPDQRVGILQQTSAQSKETTKACAVPPIRRQNLTLCGYNANKFGDATQNPAPQEAGFEVLPTPMQVKAREMQRPRITYGNGKVAPVPENCMWRQDQTMPYLIPGSVGMWACIVVTGSRREDIDAQTFVSGLVTTATKKGVKIRQPCYTNMIHADQLEAEFKVIAVEKGCEFLFTITSDTVNNQDELKLLERRYEMVTQNIKMSNVRKILQASRSATVDNLCAKLNQKLGGVNYAVGRNGHRVLHDQKTLVLGIGVSNPPPASTVETSRGGRVEIPSVVGFAGNIAALPEAFCGDFVLVRPREEDQQIIGGTVVERALQKWAEANRKAPPESIVIYRAGLSQGSFRKIIDVEIPAIKRALASADCNAKLTYCIVEKGHTIRLYRKEIDERARGPDQNVQSGTVIDTQLTHPRLKQFYLNSHITLQGTASTPRYTLLVDENEFPMAEIEQFTYELAFAHQIVNLPTSLPAPLYIANRYADRGRRLYVQYQRGEGSSTGSTDGMEQLAEMVEKLQYRDTCLANRRINA